MSYTGFAKEAIKLAKEYKGAAIKVVIVVGTIILKWVVDEEEFRCPCVSPHNLEGCVSTSEFYGSNSTCAKTVNFYYGVAHIALPAVALFLVSLLATTRLWKMITGCMNSRINYKRRHNSKTVEFCTISFKAMLAPLTWVVLMLLDGRYFACSVTALPYDVGEGKSYKTCNEVAMSKTIYTSDSFNTNVVISQVLGWGVLTVLLCGGFLLYTCASSASPLTYYQTRYLKIYRENEEYEFVDEMKLKAHVDAESNVRQFMSSRREKADWDEISRLSTYHEDENDLPVYSSLHQWVLENEHKNVETSFMDDNENAHLLP